MAPAFQRIDWVIEQKNRLILVTCSGDVSGPTYVRRIREMLAATAGLYDFDFIYDISRYRGSISNDDVKPLLADYGRSVRAKAINIIVSTDQGFPYWLALLRVQFPGCQLYLETSMAGARARLAKLRGGCSPG